MNMNRGNEVTPGTHGGERGSSNPGPRQMDSCYSVAVVHYIGHLVGESETGSPGEETRHTWISKEMRRTDNMDIS